MVNNTLHGKTFFKFANNSNCLGNAIRYFIYVFTPFYVFVYDYA